MKKYLHIAVVLIALSGCAYTDNHGNRFPKSASAFRSQVDKLVKPGDNLRQAGLALKESGYFLHGDFGPGIDSLQNDNPPANRLRDENKVMAAMIDYSGLFRYSQWIVTLGHAEGRVTSVEPDYSNGWAFDF